MWARPAGDIDRLLQGTQQHDVIGVQRANVDLATLLQRV